MQQKNQLQQNEMDRIRTDNIKLYEKIKFLQNYSGSNRGAAAGPGANPCCGAAYAVDACGSGRDDLGQPQPATLQRDQVVRFRRQGDRCRRRCTRTQSLGRPSGTLVRLRSTWIETVDRGSASIALGVGLGDSRCRFNTLEQLSRLAGQQSRCGRNSRQATVGGAGV